MKAFTEEIEGHSARFRVVRKLSLDDTASLRRALWECLSEKGVKELIVDLGTTNAAVLDPSMISVLVTTKNQIRKHRGRLLLEGIKDEDRELLRETSLLGYFDVDQALGA